MEKIIFLTIAISILIYIFYLGVSAISKGIEAKKKRSFEYNENQNENFTKDLEKLKNLFESGTLTKDEFEKAKKKILDR